MKLKVGDFLVRTEKNETGVAVVKEYFEKHDFYELQVITSRGQSHTFNIDSWELESHGWKKFNADAWYTLGQIS